MDAFALQVDGVIDNTSEPRVEITATGTPYPLAARVLHETALGQVRGVCREPIQLVMPNSFVFDVPEIEIRPSIKLRCKERLPLLAFTDEDGWYKVHVPGLGRSISAPTKPELVDALKETIAAFWQQYAGEADTNLTPRARRLKAGLLQHYAETR